MQTTEIGALPTARQVDNTPSQELGQEEFLLMLITQIENQDPLDPQDASEFTAQLAQFSSLDQLVSMRSAIDDLVANQATAQNLSIASLVGRNALVETDQIDVGPATNASVVLESLASGSVDVQLLNASGGVVASAPVSDLAAGRTELPLASFGSVPPGRYTIRINSAGNGVPVTPLVRSTVTGASFGAGAPMLLLGSVEVPLSDLREAQQ